MTLSFVQWCRQPGHRRKQLAYVHSNFGAGLLWCPKHGVLAVTTLDLKGRSNKKQMNKQQYARFTGGLK